MMSRNDGSTVSHTKLGFFQSYNSVLIYLQNYVQTISNLLKEEHHDKWEEAQLVRDKRVCVHVCVAMNISRGKK